MKLIKRILLTIFTILLLSAVAGYFYMKYKFQPPPNQLVYHNNNVTIPFIWLADSINQRPEPHGAMLLPIRLKGSDIAFYMQFDLGSPYSVFYLNPLVSISNKFDNLQIEENDGKYQMLNATFSLSRLKLTAKEIKVINYGQDIDWNNMEEKYIIGTIGADLIENKVTTINYKENIIIISDQLHDSFLNSKAFLDFDFKKRRVLLPALIDHLETEVLFDTGTSAFGLLTDKESWLQLGDSLAREETYKTNSWGNQLTVHNISSEKKIKFGNQGLPLATVTYIEGTSFVQNMLMKFSGIGGMIGNKLFLNKILILDTKNERFLLTD